jgi:hypothetical protein
MSPEEIANFKTEYREPVVATSTGTAETVLPNVKTQEIKPPKKRRRGRPPKPKVKAEQHDGETALPSNQPSSPASELLSIHPTPPILEIVPRTSSTMRPIAPWMNQPPSFQSHQLPVTLPAVYNSPQHPYFPNPFVPWGASSYNYFPGIIRCNSSQKCSQTFDRF